MALTYTGANGVFTQVGKMIKAANEYLTLGLTDLNTDYTDIRTVLNAGNAGNADQILATLRSWYGISEGEGGLRAQVTAGWRSFMSRQVVERFLDYDTILAELDISNRSIAQVWNRLIEEMTNDSESVNASVGSLGSMTAASGNVGNGTALSTLVLDGTSRPGLDMPAHDLYLGLNSELIAPDTMTLLCVADSQGSGGGGRTQEGSELWQWYGNRDYGRLSWETEGAGSGPGLVTHNSGTMVQNKDFEITGAAAATTLFPGWTIDNGTAGTHVVIESTAADVYRGEKGMRFDGDGAEASIQISQEIPLTLLQARKRYCLSLRYKASATIAAGQFTVQFEGTGYTPGGSEKIDIAAGSLATSWTLENFFVNMPATIPDDGTFKLVIKWTGTPTTAKSLWIDSLAFTPVDWHNGHGVVVVAGSTPWKVGDRITYTAGNTEGVIQKWFRLNYRVQLPSDNAAAETIADSLAT